MRDKNGRFIKGHKGYTYWKDKHLQSTTKEKIRIALKGRPLSEETKKKMLGRIPINKGKKGLQSHTLQWKRMMSERFKGEKSVLWQGGKSNENEKIRKSLDYTLWRTAVFMRDNYTCTDCGISRGWNKELHKRIEIEADHIKPFALYPELRFAIDNGRTLCKEYHRKTDTWGINFIRYNIKK